MQFYDLFVFILKGSFVIIVIVSILIGVVLPLYQNHSQRDSQSDLESSVYSSSRIVPLYQLEEDEGEIPTVGQSQGDHHREIVEMAREDPSKTTLLIRNWLREKK